MNINIFKRLRLCERDLTSNKGRDLIVFNDSSTHQCGTIELQVSIGEGNNKNNMSTCLFVISYENVYNFFLGRPLIAASDVVASTVYVTQQQIVNL